MNEKRNVLNEYLKIIDDVIEHGYYKDNWESLKDHKVPDWYRDAKFGIFIHWGPYCVPAYKGEWYSRNMYKKHMPAFTYHQEQFGLQKDFGYKDFIPIFHAKDFDAKKWVDLFEEAGAKFVMPVAEHTDGFQMYDSELSDWCAAKMGPCKDIVGELKAEIEDRGMVLTTSSHRVEHYWFMSGLHECESDLPEDLEYGHIYWPAALDPREGKGMGMSVVSGFDVDELFMQDWLARNCEIVDKYRPKIMYFDWWIQVEPMKPYLKKFAAYYYNRALEWGEEVTINYKNDAFMLGTGVRDFERGQLPDVSPTFWQNDTAVGKDYWGYSPDNRYKEPDEIICDLVDVVSKNGSLLLNVGPKLDGTIPDEDTNILREVGAWLKVNGEGIYGSSFWKKCGEGPTIIKEGHKTDVLRNAFTEQDFRYTYKTGCIYAFAMKWPEDGVVRMTLLGRKSGQMNAIIKSVEVFGAPNGCRYKLCDTHLTVIAEGITTKAPVCIKITID